MASGDCDTELCLTPGGRSSSIRQKSGDGRQEMSVSGASGGRGGGGDELPQKISVFYGGQICISDVTEIQARAIICTAKREMDEMMKSSGHSTSILRSSWAEPQPVNSRLSMKRSLQSFLQKRKSRACESSSSYPTQKQRYLHSDSSSNSS